MRAILVQFLILAALTIALPASTKVPTPEGLLVGSAEIGRFIGPADSTGNYNTEGWPLNSRGLTINTLESCVAELDDQGEVVVRDGVLQVYDVVLRLLMEVDASLLFRLDSAEPRSSATNCSGVFQGGIYRDYIYLEEVADEFEGRVIEIALQVAQRDNAQAPIELIMSASEQDLLFVSHADELVPAVDPANLGDFGSDSHLSFQVNSHPGTVSLTTPQCLPVTYNGNQLLATELVVERNGSALSALSPGSDFLINLEDLVPGITYTLGAYCSIDGSLEALRNNGVDAELIQSRSALAPGRVTMLVQDDSAEIPIAPPPPAIVPDTTPLTTAEDTPLAITFSATSPNNLDLNFNITGAPANGSLGALTPGAGSPVTTATATYTPAADFYGNDTITVEISDGSLSATATLEMTVTPVNDTPSFDKGADQTVLEDAAAQEITNWAMNIGAGAPNESGQVLAFEVSNDNNALFAVQPAIDAAGTLTYTPGPDANGSATVTVELMDDGGGTDTSPAQTFTITVTPVNDTPAFDKGVDQVVLEDAGAQIVSNWASNIDAGAPNESGQVLSFELSNDNNELFALQPAIAADGTLTYTPAPDANGSATVTVELMDDGGGADTSPAQTFTITVTAVNDAPVAYGRNLDSGPAFGGAGWPVPETDECYRNCILFGSEGFEVPVYLGGTDAELSELSFIINDVEYSDAADLVLSSDGATVIPEGDGVNYEVPGTYDAELGLHQLLTFRGSAIPPAGPSGPIRDIWHARITYTVEDDKGLVSAPKTVTFRVQDFPTDLPAPPGYVEGDDRNFELFHIMVWEDTPHYFHVLHTDPDGGNYEFGVVECTETDAVFRLPSDDQYDFIVGDASAEPALDVELAELFAMPLSENVVACDPEDTTDDNVFPPYTFDEGNEKGWFISLESDTEAGATELPFASLSLFFKETGSSNAPENPPGAWYFFERQPVNDAPRILDDGDVLVEDETSWTATYNRGPVVEDPEVTLATSINAGEDLLFTDYSIEDPDLVGDLELTVSVSGGAVTFGLDAGANVTAQTAGSRTLTGDTGQLTTWLQSLTLTPATSDPLQVTLEILDTESTGGCPFGRQDEENSGGSCDRVSTLIIDLEVD